MSVLERCPSYRESNKGSKERQGPTLSVRFIEVSVKREWMVLPPTSSSSSSSLVDWRRAVNCKASPTGSVLVSVQDVIIWEMRIGVNPFLDLVRKGLLQSPWCSFPMGGLKQCIDVGRFILLHEQNVTKELVMCYPMGLQAAHFTNEKAVPFRPEVAVN